MKNLSKPNASQKRVLWREMKGIWKKKKEIWQVRKITTGKGQVEYHSVGFPKGRNYSRGIGDTLHSSKIKVSSCQLKKKSINTPNAFPFTLIPTECSLEGHEGNVREMWGRMKKWKYVGKSQWWRWWLNIMLRESPSFFFFFLTFLFNHLKFRWNYFKT